MLFGGKGHLLCGGYALLSRHELCRIYVLFWSGFDADFYADIENFVQILSRFLHKKMLLGSSAFDLLTGLNASCFVQENRLCSCEMPTSKSGNAVVRNMKMQPWRNPCWGDLVQLRQKPQKNDFNGLNSERNEVSASSHGSLVHAFLLLAGFFIPVGPFFR